MATRISDIITPEVFQPAVERRIVETNAFFSSGVVTNNAALNALANGGGRLVNMPSFNGLVDAEPNVSSDDPSSSSTASKITMANDIAIINEKNQSWSTMDLAASLSGADPVQAIANQVGDYWSRAWNKELVAAARGVFADNTANDSDDMVHSIYDGGSPAYIDHNAIVDAVATIGDQMESLTAIAMHSAVFTRLRKSNDIDYVTDANRGTLVYPTYMGRRVIVDDALPFIADTGYLTILFGAGAFGVGIGQAPVPAETERNPASGNGGGEEILYSRQKYILHPFGVKFTDSSTAGNSPTLAELQNAANWDRVYDRKEVKLAFLLTN